MWQRPDAASVRVFCSNKLAVRERCRGYHSIVPPGSDGVDRVLRGCGPPEEMWEESGEMARVPVFFSTDSVQRPSDDSRKRSA